MNPASPNPEDAAAREWPGLRARLIDVAAALDRLDRAGALPQRLEAERLLRALLAPEGADRAERLLALLSRPYDAAWRERFAAGESHLP